MKEKTTKTEKVLAIMRVLTWIGFIGFLIEAAAILGIYCLGLISPAALRSAYIRPIFDRLWRDYFGYYTWFDTSLSVFLAVALAVVRALIFYFLIRILSKVQLRKPFSPEIVRKIERISFILLVAAALALTNDAHIQSVIKSGGRMPQNTGMTTYLFMAGLIFIISQVLKRGVELQAENDLTI